MEIKDRSFDFEGFYSRLVAYKELNGHLNIKRDGTDSDGYPLGEKITYIKRGDIKLSEEEKQQLIKLGLNLEIKDRSFDFEGFYSRLVAYKELNGHLNIKRDGTDSDGYSLGKKIDSIKQGKIKLSDKQKQKLIDLGLNLDVKKINKDNKFIFEDFYSRLVAYKELNGHLNIKRDGTDSDGYPLGQKIDSIKQGDIKLSEEQKQKLIDLGLNLEVKKSEFPFEFNDFYSRLVKYKEHNGHLNIKHREEDSDGYPLGQKITYIKQGKTKLSEEQKQKLIDLGLNLEVKKSKKKESGNEVSV